MKKIHSILDILEKEESPLIFLGGIHGVGKTTLCDECFKPLDFYCVTASSLIEKNRGLINKNKEVKNIDNNQDALIQQLNIEKSNHQKIVLDGHFCLVTNTNNIETIKKDVFVSINPTAFILLQDDPKVINARLLNRDKNVRDLSFLEKFQNMEKQHALSLSEALDVSLYILDKRLPQW